MTANISRSSGFLLQRVSAPAVRRWNINARSSIAQSLKRNISTESSSGNATITVLGKEYPTDDFTNLPNSIANLTSRKLHLQPSHPIGILRSLIESRLKDLGFTSYNDFKPVVSTYENFDALGFPEDHPGRSKTDTYYINEKTLLRTHTSAHESECFQTCETPGYLISADVYRRDTIDRTHYPAFHQMEGARVWSRTEHGDNLAKVIQEDLESIPDSGIIVSDPDPPFHEGNPRQPTMSELETELIGKHLKKTIELLMGHVFHQAREAAIKAGSTDPDLFSPIKARWIEAYFPWTSPSWEIEIWWKGEWLEMCGCGVVKHEVLSGAGVGDKIGWAFGIGLERTAMILFGVPDIRLFWSEDERFLSQFKPNTVSTFKPYSKYPGTFRDVAFWCDMAKEVHINDLMEVVRSIGGDLVENVSLIDEFVHPKTKQKSQCYRINYQSMDRSLTNAEINDLQDAVVSSLSTQFPIKIRD
ncbi:phenylalanine--tRNA ligase [Sugiyamaella lignohabitans]|uniref:Phenylalanine--tRNA ligase, mitochondrial n=1 Tax=Sugiyamaella lignohabitans TaxID=796027 RepID=A0A167F188_9ASCO|nr:phenylalanine--tRNA ligase [Sugiyamaella lignohabitans]ANB14696.1 phenylalanine--tRNA ligase [Sugiyamaella lignohabitans]